MGGRSIGARALLVLCMLLGAAANVHAHAPVEGVSDVLNGILHPLLSPAHVLILLGLGLMLAQHEPAEFAQIFAVFAPLSAVALGLTMTGRIPVVPQAALAALALVAGSIVAIGWRIPRVATGILLAIGAVGMGLDSGLDSGSTVTVLKTLVGTWISLVIVLANLVFYVSMLPRLKKQWIDIGLRVFGSWIVAIALLVLAFALRKHA